MNYTNCIAFVNPCFEISFVVPQNVDNLVFVIRNFVTITVICFPTTCSISTLTFSYHPDLSIWLNVKDADATPWVILPSGTMLKNSVLLFLLNRSSVEEHGNVWIIIVSWNLIFLLAPKVFPFVAVCKTLIFRFELNKDKLSCVIK